MKKDFYLHSQTRKKKKKKKKTFAAETKTWKPKRARMLKIKPCLDFLNPPFKLKPGSGLPLLRISIDRDPEEGTSFKYKRLQRKP